MWLQWIAQIHILTEFYRNTSNQVCKNIVNAVHIHSSISYSRMGHYNDAIMSAMASQITSLTTVYSTVYSGTDERKHQSSASLAFVRGIHRWPVNFSHKGPVTRKMFPFDDVIMNNVKMPFPLPISTLDVPSGVDVNNTHPDMINPLDYIPHNAMGRN